MTTKQPRSDNKIRKRQKLICNWPEVLTKYFSSWNVLEFMLKDRLVLSCQKEDSFGSGVEELKKKNQTIAGRGELNFICQKQWNERQKRRQQFKIILFSPREKIKVQYQLKGRIRIWTFYAVEKLILLSL